MITVVGLGPAELDRVPEVTREMLLDPGRTVIVRTLHHPAAADLASLRQVVGCDDLYQQADDFESVYRAIVDRVVTASTTGPVVYAVPGSPLIGEFAVRMLIDEADGVEVIPAESFLDALLAEVGYDPLDRGLQVLNGHLLPDPLVLDKPTVIAHLDRPEVLAEVAATIARVVPEEARVMVVVDAGGAKRLLAESPASEVDPGLAGLRTSMFVDADPGGLIGAVHTMRRLRRECPWDREQTHHSLVKNLVEEAYELIEAISSLPGGETDWVAYSGVEDELGDLFLQVLFHEAIARESGAFDLDDVAEGLRRKLVRRHPHVFGDSDASSPEEVKARWDQIKAEERGETEPGSALSGVPAGMPALHRASKVQNRAAKVGFDWDRAEQVVDKLREEIAEMEAAMTGSGVIEDEVGDILFTVVNLARHLGVDGEVALQRAVGRFSDRFLQMEAEGPLEGLDIDELNARWDRAK